MARSSLFILFFAALCTSSFVFCQSTEQKMMANLYKGVEDLVIPSYNPNSGSPTQVILFEFPGLAINRAEYDPIIWAAGGFDARQPDAVFASFVNRLPYYTGPTFVDSGATISDLWSHFMYQYIIPIVDDPIQTKKVNDARLALANGTLENAYDVASSSYAQAFAALVTFRSDCLSKQPGGGGVCSAEGVIYRERLKRKWFNLEVARRDIAAAEAKIIALQIQDLKNQFAEALYGFASNERVDMGASGFGNSYYLTYATPSNFWRWWPNSGLFDYSVYADGSFVVISPAAGATIVQPPVNGFLTALGNGSYSYRPNAGYTGTDSVLWTNNVTINGVPTQVDTFKSIQVIGTDVTISNTAFVTVSVAASSSESTSSSFATAQASSSSFSAGIGWFSVSGSRSQSSSSSSSTTNSLSSDSKMTFSLARVAITRPWLDVSILSFYPVAIRNINKQGWSDGTVTAPAGPLQFKFKILPVAFLVARNVQISTTLSTSMSSFQADASASASSLRVSFGPFFSGSTSSSQSQSSRNYHEQSSFSGGGISIRGPQVIGWVCTPLPAFPTANEDEVRKWEADQVKRQADIASGNVTTTSK